MVPVLGRGHLPTLEKIQDTETLLENIVTQIEELRPDVVIIDSIQGLRPRHRRERNPERPPSNSHGDWPFLRPPERSLSSPS